MVSTNDKSNVQNAYIYVIGGYYFGVNSYKYDIKYEEWKAIKSLPHPRSGHTVVAINNTLYAIGGYVDVCNHKMNVMFS